MDKAHITDKFEANVRYLRKVVPPDDIYMYAELNFMAALYFLHNWSDLEDLNEKMESCDVAKAWISNIMLTLKARSEGDESPFKLELDIE